MNPTTDAAFRTIPLAKTFSVSASIHLISPAIAVPLLFAFLATLFFLSLPLSKLGACCHHTALLLPAGLEGYMGLNNEGAVQEKKRNQGHWALKIVVHWDPVLNKLKITPFAAMQLSFLQALFSILILAHKFIQDKQNMQLATNLIFCASNICSDDPMLFLLSDFSPYWALERQTGAQSHSRGSLAIC